MKHDPEKHEVHYEPVVIPRPVEHFLGLTKTAMLALILSLLVVGVAALAVFLSYEVGKNRQLITAGTEAHAALCALRGDLGQRIVSEREQIATTTKFLMEHPAGIPGVPVALLRQSLQAQSRTVAGQLSTVRAIDSALKGC